MQLVRRGDRTGVRIHLGGGRRKWVGTFATPAEARAAGREAEQKARAGTLSDETWGEFAERWLAEFNHVRRDGSLRWGAEHVRNLGYALTGFTEKWGTVPMGEFPDREALPWVGQQPESVLRAVRSLFNDARKSGLVVSNPFERLGLEKSRGRSQIVALTEEEVLLLADCALGACEDYGQAMRALLLWQGYVGCRPIATFNVRPDDLDVGAGTVYLRHPGKKVKPRTVIVPPPALEALGWLPVLLRQSHLFVSPRGRKLTNTSLTHHWNKVRPVFEAKLDPRRGQELRDARPDGGMVELYELRHAAATMLLERGLALGKDVTADVAWQLCNSEEKIREVYGHPKDEGRRHRLHGLFDGVREAANG